MTRILRLWLVVALTTACAHPPPPLRVTRLEVQNGNGGVRPLVRATVAGAPVTFLVDTGAAHSVLPAELARSRRLRTGSDGTNRTLVDANGNRVTMQLLPNVPIQFEGEREAGTMDFLMEPTGSGFALLAPQELVRPGWVVIIDLDRQELRREPEDEALRRLQGEGVPLREEDFHRCIVLEGPHERNHRVVATTINGVAADMLVDTGAELTVLARNNPAIPSMLRAKGDRTGLMAVTSRGEGLVVDGVPIEFAKATFRVPAIVTPTSSSCWKGALGADLLRHCTIVWGWSTLWTACRADGAPPTPPPPPP